MLGIMLSITAGVICICLLVEPINVSSRKNNFRINKNFKQMHLNDRMFKIEKKIIGFIFSGEGWSCQKLNLRALKFINHFNRRALFFFQNSELIMK